ncbi:MAG: hypothetical protein HY684_07610 [Chloroflexi bacterium]|nr:hypothetical protein [Chloroflexota bacterium]
MIVVARTKVAEALQRTGGREAQEALRAMLQDPNGRARAAAEASLGALTGEEGCHAA